MPNYKALTIEAECAVLDKKLEAIKDTDAKLNTKGIAEGSKKSLTDHRNTLVGDIGKAVDKVLAACDVAESNNQVYCQYIIDAHTAAKLEMAKVEPLLKKLETAWDDKVAFVMTHAIGQVNQWRDKLKQDDVELRAVKMVGEYRGNAWKISVNSALVYVPDRKAAFQQREKSRQDGIQHSTKVVGHRDRIGEYVTRAEAMKKTAEMLLQKEMGAKKDFAKIREDMIDFAEGAEKTSTFYVGQLVGTGNQVATKVKDVMGAKAITKETYKPLILLEPKIDALLKEAKAKAKTLRIQFAEETKKVQVKGMEDRYFKPQLARADVAIKKLEAQLLKYAKEIEMGRKMIETGKKLK